MMNVGPSDATEANLELAAALVSIIADPKLASDHLAKIRAETEILNKKLADLPDAVELDARHLELTRREAAVADANAIINEANKAKDKADALARDLESQQREYDARMAALAARERDLDLQEAVYRARQQAFDARQRELDDQQKQLDEAEADYKLRTKYIGSFLETKQDRG